MKLKFLPSTISLPSFPLFDFNHNASSSSVRRQKHSFNFAVASKSKKHHHNNHAQGSDSQPSPPRITSNPKQNLQLLRSWKEYQKRKSTSPKRTSYRKKKAEKKDIRDDDLYREPTSSLSQSNKLIIQKDVPLPVLLVDGYNVCGYWLKLKKHFMSGQLELARQLLIDDLKTFSRIREFKVVVVFDAMMSGFPNHTEHAAGIDIVFSSKTSADAWIEKKVLALKEGGCPDVWVATSDHSQQEAVYWAGAFVWSCKALINEIKASQQEAAEMLREQRATSFRGSLLKHNLDAKVVDALRNLRQKLAEQESKQNIKLKF